MSAHDRPTPAGEGDPLGAVERSSVGLALAVPPELVELVAVRAAELVADRLAPHPWLDVAGAAEHLACPLSRVYALVSASRIPHHRDGSRLLFRRDELDGWVERGGAKRP